MKGSPSKHLAIKIDVNGQEKKTVCRRVRASFSPEILQAGAVKGLKSKLGALKTDLDAGNAQSTIFFLQTDR